MQEQTGEFQGAQEIKLFYRAWLPDSAAKAILVIIHGVGEHIGRYQNLVDALVPAGFILAGYDQRGHGRSQGQRGHINAWEEYREDARSFISIAHKLAPGLPLFLYGHSMGSLVLLDYILHYPEGLAGAISSGTALDVQDAAPAYLVTMARLLSGIAPKMPMKMPLDGSKLSRNPEVARAYNEDPLVKWDRSMRWGTESMQTVARINDRAGEIKLPILFVHGELDPLVKVTGAQRCYDLVSSKDKTIKIYPGTLHEPHNDVDYKRVMSDIENWLTAHLRSSAVTSTA